MDQLTFSPIYEFPYSDSEIPFSNYKSGSFILNIIPSIDSSIYNQSPTFNLNSLPQIAATPGKDDILYEVPENVPIDTILRQLGIDIGSVQQNNNPPSIPLSLELIPAPSLQRRRRLVCREELDSNNDHCPQCSSYHYRNHHDSEYNRSYQLPPHIHNLLTNAWNKPPNASENVFRSNSMPNVNSQWEAMKNATTPTPLERQSAVYNAWNQTQSPPKKKPNRLLNLFTRKKSGTIVQPPQPNLALTSVWNNANDAVQQGFPSTLNQPWNQMLRSSAQQPFPPIEDAGNQMFNTPPQHSSPAMSSAWNQVSGGSPPSPVINSAWNQMSRAPPPPQYSSPAMSSAWNQLSRASPPSPAINSAWNQMSRPSPPPQHSPPIISSAWNQISRASSPPPVVDSAWNQMSRASPPPQHSPPIISSAWNQLSSASPPSPAISSAWNQMSRASPPPQHSPPIINSAWNQISRASSPPPVVDSAWNQMFRAPTQGSQIPAGSTPFASLLARSYPQYPSNITAM